MRAFLLITLLNIEQRDVHLREHKNELAIEVSQQRNLGFLASKHHQPF